MASRKISTQFSRLMEKSFASIASIGAALPHCLNCREAVTASSAWVGSPKREQAAIRAKPRQSQQYGPSHLRIDT
jgi:hypothetical protein